MRPTLYQECRIFYDPVLATSGQSQRNQFEAIAAAGHKVVVNVAPADSHPDALRDEQQVVEAAGVEYYAIPIKWALPDVNQVPAAVKLLEGLHGKPILCRVPLHASAAPAGRPLAWNYPSKAQPATAAAATTMNGEALA